MMFARTPRLMLRPGWPEDMAAWRAAAGEDVATGPSPRRSPAPCDIAGRPELPRLLIFLREGGPPRLIGGIALARRDADAVELDCWIAPANRGRGYATEAGRAMLDIAAMLGIRHVAVPYADAESGRLPARPGFVRTGGIVTRHDLSRDTPVPSISYSGDDRGHEPLAA